MGIAPRVADLHGLAARWAGGLTLVAAYKPIQAKTKEVVVKLEVKMDNDYVTISIPQNLEFR